MKSNQLTSGALAMVLNYQKTGCEMAAKQAIIALNALIDSKEIPAELIEQALVTIEELDRAHC
ncbi:MAG: hypothetical protein Q7K13_05565 [Polynucleobacter sp.]|uniref:hypothetical protein n=1 Tax=Polynucleobacter sp. TaxID=2029855 RepID=UPI002720FCA1|nr:hypothetical protein [Polynucleobacter sp.]MDO8713930.1 hypothetical protein [Polynucleobacter sp.]